MSDADEEEETREVTVDVPAKEPQEKWVGDHREERRTTSIADGPAIAFTGEVVRVYDDEYDEYVELTHRELAIVLADIYDIE